MAASGYLTYVHFAGTQVACPTSGCERVQHSFYASPHGVPISLLGAVLFLAIAALTPLRAAPARRLATSLALAGGVVAVYLIAIQLFSVRATCLWCLASDGALVALAGIAAAQLVTEARVGS